ncbi:MAG: DNA polymerase III subunit delta' [Cocleimonas sp.]
METTEIATIQNYPWHQESWDYFVKAHDKNHLPHALLIVGENGIGKLDFANRLVKSLLCITAHENSVNDSVDNKRKYDACNHCKACKTYESQANPDYLNIDLLEDKQQIGIDQVRQLSTFLSLSRSFNSYRVVLLNQVERMNLNAANSLLKSLEEPTNNTVIILLTSQLNRLLPTMKSRCQILKLPTPIKAVAQEWIQHHSPEINNPEELLDMAYGKPLAALKIDAEEIQSRKKLSKDLIGLINNKESITAVAKTWEKYNSELLLNWQITWVQDFIKQSIQDKPLNNSEEKQTLTLLELSQLKSVAQLWQIYHELIKQKRYIHTSVNPLMFVENMLMLWCK